MEKQSARSVRVRNQTRPRKSEKSQQYLKEREWFAADYLKPRGVLHKAATIDLSPFTHLIWESPTRLIIPEYGITTDEMARLCGQGADGQLLSCHMTWIMDKLNANQEESLCLCLSTSSPQEMERFAQGYDIEKLKRLIFMANVGRDHDGSVFFSSSQRLGSHWVLITVDLTESPTILYCDSLAWGCPKDLLSTLSLYTAQFGALALHECNLCILHEPVSTGKHCCSDKCRNYPLQTCSNVCGVVVSVCAVVAALDSNLFATITGPRRELQLYLHAPTKYEQYLRRVLISWFMSSDLDVSLVNMNLTHRPTTCTSVWNTTTILPNVHLTSLTKSQKRKSSEPMSHPTPKHANSSVSLQHTQHKTIGRSCESESHSLNQTCLNTITDNATNMPTEDRNISVTGVQSLSCGQTKTECNNLPSNSTINPDHTSSSCKEKKERVCTFCNAIFSHRQSLDKHRKKKHPEQIARLKKENESAVSCQICFEPQSSKIQELIFHYNNKHRKHMQIMNKTFSHEEEFKQWKKNIEKVTLSKFKKPRGDVHSLENITSYYRCHRSGKKIVVKNPSRLRKSCKIDNHCTAFMTVRTNTQNPSINVEYCLHHIGHESSNLLKSVIAQENPDASDNVEKLRKAQENPEASDNIEKLRKVAIGRINEIGDLLKNSNDACMLQEMLKRLNDVYNTGRGMQQIRSERNIEKKDPFLSNEKCISQNIFFSTKREGKVHTMGQKLELKN